jgi:hypothetical protein
VRETYQLSYKGKHVRITAFLSVHTLKARKAWSNTLQTLRQNNCYTRILYLEKLSFSFDGEIKTFQDKDELKCSCPSSLHYRRYLREYFTQKRKEK